MPRSRRDLLRLTGELVALGTWLALFPSAAGAKTWEVTSASALSAALADADAGDRIHIHQGGAVPHHVAPAGGWKIRKPVEIFGDGAGVPYAGMSPRTSKATWLHPASPADDVFVIDLSGWPEGKPFENLYIHDLFIGRDAKSSGSGRGIYFAGSPNKQLVMAHIARVSVFNMGGDGIFLAGTDTDKGAIERLTIDDCTSAFNGGDGVEIVSAIGPRIFGGQYRGNKGAGVSIRGCNEPQVNNAAIESNQTAPVGSPSDGQLYLENPSAFSVTGCHFENFKAAGGSTALSMTVARGGYIGNNSFGQSPPNIHGSIGILAWQGRNKGIVIGPNFWSQVDTILALRGPDNTSCTLLPQAINIKGPAACAVSIPDGADHGHVIWSPTNNDTTSVTSGLVLPGISGRARDAMSPPPSGTRREGLVIYNRDKHRFEHWDGAKWVQNNSGVFGAQFDSATVQAPFTKPVVFGSVPAGMYRVSIYALTKARMNKEHKITIRWTDEAGERSFSPATMLGVAEGSLVVESVPIHTSGGNLSLLTSVQDGGTMSGAFALRIRVESMP